LPGTSYCLNMTSRQNFNSPSGVVSMDIVSIWKLHQLFPLPDYLLPFLGRYSSIVVHKKAWRRAELMWFSTYWYRFHQKLSKSECIEKHDMQIR
jgi:hypothetical protein